MVNKKIKSFLKGSAAKKLLACTMALSMLCCFAFAEDATPTTVGTVTAAMGDGFSMVGTIINQIAAQPLLLFLLAVSFIPIGIRIFKMLKGAARK